MPCLEGPGVRRPAVVGPGNRRHRYRRQALTFCDVSRLLLMTVPSLSLSRQFSMELHGRAIDECDDIEELRRVARTLLTAWQLQASMSEQYGAELLGLHRTATGL